MRTFVVAGLAVAVSLSAAAAGQGPRREPAVKWEPCRTPPVEPCFTHRGRLSAQNGIAHMLWLVGTKRIVAVDGNMPEVLAKYLDMTSPDLSDIYGDYEICPLELDQPGRMRQACVSSATRLVVQDRARVRPPIRLLATWPTLQSK